MMAREQAIIRGSDCIGCTKCLDACPTDAIIGAPNFLHSVIEEDCIGCERCLPVCPTDCIELHPMADVYNPEALQGDAKAARIAYIRTLAEAHKQRKQHDQLTAQNAFEQLKSVSESRKDYLQSLYKKELK